MPIRPENKDRYPKDWKAIVAKVRERSGDRCECHGECGLHHGRRCVERHKTKAKWANGMVILTTAHLDHKPETRDLDRLRHMCNRCHLRYDRVHHSRSGAIARDKRRGQLRLALELELV